MLAYAVVVEGRGILLETELLFLGLVVSPFLSLSFPRGELGANVDGVLETAERGQDYRR